VGRQKGVVGRKSRSTIREGKTKIHKKRIKVRLLWKCFNNFNSHSHYIMKMFYICFVIHIMFVCFVDDAAGTSNVTSEGNGNNARTKNNVSVLPSSVEDSSENIILSSI
jgi:hypothetical protein